MFTTLNQIRAESPCAYGWKKLLAYLGKTQADDEPLNIATIIDSNGIYSANWCLQAVEGKDKELRLYAVWCARQVQHLMTDKRSLDALDVAERFANGEATQEELNIARFAAWAAAGIIASAGAARAAGAAWCVTSDTARYTTFAAAWAATGADSSDAMPAVQEARLREICQY